MPRYAVMATSNKRHPLSSLMTPELKRLEGLPDLVRIQSGFPFHQSDTSMQIGKRVEQETLLLISLSWYLF